MSGVYIKGMEMPTRCYTCPCADLEFYDCNLMPGTRIEQHKRLDNCPLVPVPPHGRLIDADALEKLSLPRTEMIDGEIVQNRYVSLGTIRQMPTIIPAEDE